MVLWSQKKRRTINKHEEKESVINKDQLSADERIERRAEKKWRREIVDCREIVAIVHVYIGRVSRRCLRSSLIYKTAETPARRAPRAKNEPKIEILEASEVSLLPLFPLAEFWLLVGLAVVVDLVKVPEEDEEPPEAEELETELELDGFAAAAKEAIPFDGELAGEQFEDAGRE